MITFPSWIEASTAIVIGLGTIVAVIAFGYFSGKNGSKKALEESNKSLRSLLEDKEKEWNNKFDTLQRQHTENVQQIGQLQGKVENLEHQNGDFKSLILQSLESFWKNNPDAAARVHMELSSGRV